MMKHLICATVALALAFLVAGCGHNTVSYGDGIMLETTINPETYAFGVSLRYGKILTACVRENTTVEMTGGNNTTGGGSEKGSTAANTEASVKVKVGKQVTGYYVDAIKAGAKPEEVDKYTDEGNDADKAASAPKSAEKRKIKVFPAEFIHTATMWRLRAVMRSRITTRERRRGQSSLPP